jgi:predicted nucleic acid-binding protein
MVMLDTGPLGLAAKQPRNQAVIDCLAWLARLETSGTEVLIPEIADYEVRRELIRARAHAGLRRLDALHAHFGYVPLTTSAIRRAAAFWAEVRQQGVPTADRHALDADAILAGQAMTAAQPGDVLTVATMNLAHLGHFAGIDAQMWTTVV